MKLPKHINLIIEHNPQAANYETAAQWLEHNDLADVTAEDAAEIVRTGEVWTVQWYPNTPVGFCAVAAATLERALKIANTP